MENLRVYLRALEPDDYLVSYYWRNDHDLMNGVHGIPRFVSKETERKWVLSAISEHESGKCIRLAICLVENKKHIGYIYLSNIDYHNQSCSINILIGDRSELRKGFAKEASIIILHYAFMELGMKRMKAQIVAFNDHSKKLWEGLGFKLEGRTRKSVFRNGEFHDELIYSLLREDYLDKYQI